MLTVGSLFAGIGGFDLGLERAGMRTAWQVELDPFCRAVLARHFPDAERHTDVRGVGVHNLEPVDVICGGFPCQDLSVAGRGAGLDGARSGLWSEYARIVGELRPRYVVVENVAALLARGLGRVLGDLAALGYDAEWDCIPASAVGAPHRRDRVWLVAYPADDLRRPLGRGMGGSEGQGKGEARVGPVRARNGSAGDDGPTAGRPPVADANGSERTAGTGQFGAARRAEPCHGGSPDEGRPLDAAGRGRHGTPEGQVRARGYGAVGSGWWAVEPDVGRVAHGVPARVDRLRALGNALVPQIAEAIGRRILDYESSVTA